MVKLRESHWSLRFFPEWVDAWVLGEYIFFRYSSPAPALLLHELAHVKQYRRYGVIGFLARYIWWSIRYGYKNNPLEVEARRYECYSGRLVVGQQETEGV